MFEKWWKKKAQKKQDQECAQPFFASLAENKKFLQDNFRQAADAVFRDGYLGNDKQIPMLIFYLDNTINSQVLDRDILKPLFYESFLNVDWSEIPKATKAVLQKNCIAGGQLKEAKNWQEFFDAILYGWIAIFIAGQTSVLMIQAPGWPKRAPSAPMAEKDALGSRLGFVENLGDNIALLRMRVRSLQLSIERVEVGTEAPTYVGLVYLAHKVDKQILQQVKQKLEELQVESVVLSGELSQLLEEPPLYLFPKVKMTEKLEMAIAGLFAGRIVLLVDGNPYVLILPAPLQSFLITSDDYAERYIPATFLRSIRFLAILIAVLLPGIYIALTTMNVDLVPYELLLSIAKSRQSVVFSPLIEALFMAFFLEVLQEGSLRLPSAIGQTVGIVGGIALGQAIVSAKLVSPIVIIVISLTAVSSFVIPNYSIALIVRVLRFGFMLLGGVLGLFGISIGIIFLLTMLAGAETFGTPYFAPYAPVKFRDWKDAVLKFPPDYGGALLTKKKVFAKKQEGRK